MMDSFLGPTDLDGARYRVEAAVAERCRKLDLPTEDGDGAVVRLAAKRSFASQRDLISTDTACVVADLVLWRWSPSDLDELAESLAPDTVLVFVEPTADLGWRRLVHRIARPLLRVALGHHFEADVPAALRAAGLVVTTTDRFGTGPLRIRSYVWGEARHFPGL